MPDKPVIELFWRSDDYEARLESNHGIWECSVDAEEAIQKLVRRLPTHGHPGDRSNYLIIYK